MIYIDDDTEYFSNFSKLKNKMIFAQSYSLFFALEPWLY